LAYLTLFFDIDSQNFSFVFPSVQRNSSCGCVVHRWSSYGALVEYGCEKKVTQFSNLSASIAVGVPSGVTLKLRLFIVIT